MKPLDEIEAIFKDSPTLALLLIPKNTRKRILDQLTSTVIDHLDLSNESNSQQEDICGQ